jgi:hypothetical protein
MVVRASLFAVAGLALAGCSCNQEYTWEEYKTQIQVSEPSVDFGSWLSMDAAPDDSRLAIAYYDRDKGGLGFAVGVPAEDGSVVWTHERVDGYAGDDGLDRGDRGKYASMKVAADGTVWVSYQNSSAGGLWVAHRTGKAWEAELVDGGTGTVPRGGAWTSLALDEDQNPVVVHYDENAKVLRRAALSDGAWVAETIFEGEPWSGVDGEGAPISRKADVGSYARIFIDGDTEYIAFYDGAWQSLHLLEGKAGDYKHEVVDADGNVGQWPSFAKDGDKLYLAYHDVGRQDLRLATREGDGAFDIEVVDAGEHHGADTEVFVKGGEAQVLYSDGQNNDQLVAKRDGNGWAIEKISGDDGALGFHNEVTKVGEDWWTGSYDFTHRTLVVKKL